MRSLSCGVAALVVLGFSACGSSPATNSEEATDIVRADGRKSAHENDSHAATDPVSERKGTATAEDGTAIHYSVRGQGPETLVLVHGWSCDQSYWSEQVAGLAGEFRLVTLDLAGHGKSETSRSDWSIQSFGQDVVAVIEELQLHDVTLVGHSMGGMVVLEAAIAAPERVSAVIGVDTLHDNYAAPKTGELLASLREDFAKVTEPLVRGWFPETTPQELVDWVAADMAAQDPGPGVEALAAVFRWGPERMRTAIEDLPTPLGLIQTSAFRRASTIVEKRENALQALRFIELGDLSHFLMLEDPPRFNAALRSMVQELADL